MRWLRRYPAAALALALACCQPYYRDDLVRGRAGAGADKLFSAASRASSQGDHRKCARLARRAIALNPNAYASDYLVLARCQLAAGQHARARATARRGLEQNSGDSELQRFLVEAYRADDLTANALDFVYPPSIEGAVAAGVTELADLVTALHQSRTDPAGALALYARWLAEYGVPDHRMIRDARDRLLIAASRDPKIGPRLSELLTRAQTEVGADQLEAAILHYSQAYQLLPETTFADNDYGLAAAAARVASPAVIDPWACNHAKDGNDALRKQQLGAAIHHYRRAVASAPWWAAARRNLGLLLRVAGQHDEAERQLAWASRLAAGNSTGGSR